ncbi:hypothetical protein MTR_0157s0040 [Medicago truncatula]|uniref:Uncharacterized protein n=1 Tax=Medicago truncatula TaxID=3880 RepID=A0A072TSI5_MEDTR|nr:hypothetical protein MTR_0157s0040 [Medicago truncatula]
MKYAEMLPTLLKKNLVQTRAPPRVPNKLPTLYRSDCFCAFHQGAPDHDIEHCYALRVEVQKLIEENTWSFEDPNVLLKQPQQQYPAYHPIAAITPVAKIWPQQQDPTTDIDLIPVKCADLLLMLLERNLVHTKASLPVPA